MNANQLRASILQMAIEGKLVPQLDSEPAVEQLGNAPEDVPFEIPEKWKWVQIRTLGKTTTGSTPPKNNPNYYGNDIPFVNPGDIQDSKITFRSEGLSNEARSLARIVSPFSILMVCIGGCIGKCAISSISTSFNQQINALTPDEVHSHKLIFYFLISQYFQNEVKQLSTGTATPIINKNKWSSIYIPLPPLEEQKRIVAKLEKLLPLVDEYGKAYEKLEELNAEFPDKLKASVLQSAIEGKLVPQLDSEPVASEYLKGLNPKVKFVDESETNYSIPDKWRIVKLSSICTKIVDGDHNPPKGELEPTKYLMLSAKNINNNSLIINDAVRFLSKENFETSHSRTQLAKDDVLLTIVGTLGRSCVVEDVSENITFQRSVACLSTLIYSKYLKYFLDAPDVQKYITINAKGTAQKGFYLNQLKNLHIAIPPLEEQKRIVAKVEELFALIDAMKKQLTLCELTKALPILVRRGFLLLEG